MAAVSYQIAAGQVLENVVAATAAPTSGAGYIELRIDQTTTAITEGTGTRALKRGEVFALLKILEEYLTRDQNVVQ